MADPDVEWALKTLAKRINRYRTYQDYYDGKQRLLFATDKFLNAFGPMFRAFADNLCLSVVDALADRLSIRSFNGDGADAANEFWKTAWHGPRLSGTIHVEAGRSGDAYAIVWPDRSGVPRLWPQNPAQCAIERDEEEPDVVLRGAKCWVTGDGFVRLNIYRPEVIFKWVTRRKVEGAALPSKADDFVLVDSPGIENPLPNTYGIIPLFHFTNNASTYGGLGRSELSDVIPLQDALNKAIADMLVGMEFLALPQRWGTGVEVPEDPNVPGRPAGLPTNANPTGQQVNATALRLMADRMLTVANDEAKFGQFPAADLKQFLEVQDAFRLEIARVSGRPPQYMQLSSISNVSDDALRTLETRIVKTAGDRQDEYGETWLSAVNLGLQIAGSSPVEAIDWDEAATEDELRKIEVAEAKLRIGVSKRQVLKELKVYDDELIDEMLGEAEASARAAEEALIRSALTGADSSAAPPPPPPRDNARV